MALFNVSITLAFSILSVSSLKHALRRRVPAMTRARHPSYLDLPRLHILYRSIADPEPDCYTAPGCKSHARRDIMTWAQCSLVSCSYLPLRLSRPSPLQRNEPVTPVAAAKPSEPRHPELASTILGKDGAEMVLVPAGEFTMRSTPEAP